MPQSTVSHRLDSSSGATCSCCHRSDNWSHLETLRDIAIDSNITDDIIRKLINGAMEQWAMA